MKKNHMKKNHEIKIEETPAHICVENITCENCIFGTPEIVKRGKAEVARCRCHVARPTRSGFPLVNATDYCSCHVDRVTMRRTFTGLVAE